MKTTTKFEAIQSGTIVDIRESYIELTRREENEIVEAVRSDHPEAQEIRITKSITFQ